MSDTETSQPPSRPEEAGTGSRFRLPDIYVILFVFIALAAISTHFLPASQYNRVQLENGRTAIDAESFRYVEADPVGIVEFMTAIPRGLADASVVVFFTFIIGGMFMVIRRTGLIEVAVEKLTRRFAERSVLVVPVLMTTFAVIATLIGTQELSLVYVPVILPLMIALGFDSIVAVGVALCATTAGFTAGVLNPINTGLAQTIAGVPLWSGIWLRVLLFICLLVAGAAYVMRYASRVRADGAASLLADDPEEEEKRRDYLGGTGGPAKSFSSRQIAAGFTALAFFAVMVWGVLAQGWFMTEMSGLFILMGITVGLVAGLTTQQICNGFNAGFREVLVGAMIVGIARAVAVMFEDAQVLDTLTHGLGELVGGFPQSVAAVGMFLSQMGFNFVIPSGSGQALVTMPVMAPLSDIVGVTRQTAILAYQMGDGFSNILFPTSGYFMATLALAGVSWSKWVRFFLPLFAIWAVIGVAFMIFAQVIQWTG